LHAGPPLVAIVIALGGCASVDPGGLHADRSVETAAPTPTGAVTSAVAPKVTAAPNVAASASASASGAPATAAPIDREKELARVIRCATAASETLGWIGNGAHWGQFMTTAMQHGGMPSECADFADENEPQLKIAGESVLWRQEEAKLPIGKSVKVPMRFWMGPDETAGLVVKANLAHQWHCFSWVHFEAHGDACYPTRAACVAGSKQHHNVIPCDVIVGSAWCKRGTDDCFVGPWSCQRRAGVPAVGPEGSCEKKP